MSNTDPSYSGASGQAASDSAAEHKFESGREHASQAAREVKEAAMLKAREYKGAAVHRAQDVRHQIENSVQDYRSRAEARTREDPLKSLAIAFGVGFIAGIIFRR